METLVVHVKWFFGGQKTSGKKAEQKIETPVKHNLPVEVYVWT